MVLIGSYLDDLLSSWRRKVHCDSLPATDNEFMQIMSGGYIVDIAYISERDEFRGLAR